jgi:hypothetical protein
MDSDTLLLMIFAWVMTLIGVFGLGTWLESKDHKPEYTRGSHFAIQYYQEFDEFPTSDVIEKAYYYGRMKYIEEISIIRKKAGLEFVIPNSLKEKGVDGSK